MPIALFALILAFLPAGATGQIVGSVTSASGEALPGANVFVEGTTIGSATDARGHFQIAALEPGDYVVRASIVGFETDRQRVTVAPGQTASVDFVLQPRTGNLAEVVVTARESLTGGPAGVRDLPGSAHYVGPRELRAHTDGDVMRVLREIPGVNVQEEDGYGLRPNIGLRGVGTERTSKITVMEDGILIAPAPYAAPAAYYFPTLGPDAWPRGAEGRQPDQVRTVHHGRRAEPDHHSDPHGVQRLRGGIHRGQRGAQRARPRRQQLPQRGLPARNVSDQRGRLQGDLPAPDDLETGFDKQDYMAKIRVNTNPTARIYQALELKLSRNDEVSRETYLGLTADDFARTPFRRYAGSQADRMEAAQRQATLRHVAVFSDRFDLTTTVYRTSFARNWYKLQTVRAAGQANRSLATVLDAPDAHAAEMALLRGEASTDLEDGRLTVRANNREYLVYGAQSIAGMRIDLGPTSSLLEIGVRLHRDEMDRLQWEDEYAMTPAGQMNRVVAGTPGSQDNRIDAAEALAAFAQAEVRVWTTHAHSRDSASSYHHAAGKLWPQRPGPHRCRAQ
jgi:Fe(3+) dicitrate transport protein